MAILNEAHQLRSIRPVAPEHHVGDLIQPGHPLFGLVWINTFHQPEKCSNPLPLGYQGLDSAQRVDRGRKSISTIVRFSLLGVALAIGVLAVLRSLNRTSSGRPLVGCARNLQDIGRACQEYAIGHNGRYPAAIEEIFLSSDLFADCFVCPSSLDIPAPGKTKAAKASHFAGGHHVSYIYVGKGLTDAIPDPTDVVMAYEPMANHGDAGSNFLFADGHVAWRFAKEAAALIAAIPVTQPTTAPFSSSSKP